MLSHANNAVVADSAQTPSRPAGRRRRLSREITLLLSAVLIAVTVRILYLVQLSSGPGAAVAVGPDVREYHTWALDILGGALLWGRVHIHAPLYAYFLAGLYWLTDQNVLVVRAVQLGLDVASLVMTALALRTFGRRRAALFLAWLWAICLPLIYYSGELVCEGLLVFWISAALLSFAKASRAVAKSARKTRAGALFLLPGLFLGLAAVTHPLSLGFGLVCPFLAGRRTAAVRGRRFGVAAAAILFGGLFLPIFLVALRNTVVSSEVIPIQARAGLNFFIGNNPNATGTCYVRPGRPYEQLLEAPTRSGVRSESAATRFYLARSWEFIRRHPLQWTELLGRKLLLTWNARELTSGADLPELRYRTPLMHSLLLRFGVIAPLAFLGLVFERRRRGLAVFTGLVVAYTAVLTLLVVSGRYRMGMLPGVLALAAAGGDWLWHAARQRDSGRLTAALVALVIGTAAAYVPKPPSLPTAPAETAMIRGETAYRTGALDAAEKGAFEVLASAPEKANAWLLLGLVASDRGNQVDAIRFYRQALKLSPNDPEISVDLAISLSVLGEKDEAADLLARTLKRRPDSAQAWYNLGVIRQEQGRLIKAADAYRAAIRLHPGLASPHLNLAVILQQQGKLDEALRHYHAAVRVAPHKVNAINALAVFLAGRGDVRNAIHWFEKSLDLDPHQKHIWLMYSDFLLFSHRKEAAVEVVRRACLANPEMRRLRQAPPGPPPPKRVPASHEPTSASSAPTAEKR